MKKLLITIALHFSVLSAQTFSDYAFSGYDAVASAGSVVAFKGGESSLYHNPSGLSEVNKTQINFSHSKLYNLNFLPYLQLSVILPTSFGKFGISYQDLSVKYSSRKLISEQAIGISQGFFLQKDRNSTLALGYSVNFLTVNQGTTISGEELGFSKTIGIDLGLQASFRKRHRLGAFIKNINHPEISGMPLPQRLNIGFAYIPYNQVLTSFTISRLLGAQSTQFMGGFNYKLNQVVSVAIGVQSNPNRIGAGFKLQFITLEFGYGLLTHHVLPMTHQFSLGWIIE